jgi:hypothetical protein
VTTESPTSHRSVSRLAVALIAVGLLVVVLLVAVPLVVTSNPAFFSRYTELTRRYTTLQSSIHRDLTCVDCHGTSGGPIGYRVALIGDFYTSLFSKQRLPAYTKFENPDRATCVKCHLGAWSYQLARTSQVPHPAHLRVSTERRDCVTVCHKWTAHEETYMAKHKTFPFSGVCVTFGCHVGYKQADQCDKCHHTIRPDQTAWKKDHPAAVRVVGANGCLEKCHDAKQCQLCHTTGRTPVFTGLQAQSGTKALEAMHAQKDWLQQHGTQALLDKSKCLICHISEGECNDCHSQRPDFHGSPKTWLVAHKALGTNRARCLACHKASFCKACHDQFKEK